MDEGELIVSQRDLEWMHVIRLTLEGRASVGREAELLGLSTRHVKRLRNKMKERGAQVLDLLNPLKDCHLLRLHRYVGT